MEHYVTKLRRLHIPTHIQLELTKKCNWNCKFCYAECGGENGLSTNDLFCLFRKLKAEGTLEINFTGGEPLTREDCFEIFDYAKSLGFSLTINTNGSLISEKNSEKIKQLFSHIEISLHSSDESIHDQLVQTSGAWKRTMNGLKLLEGCKNRVLVKCVLTSEEIADIDIFKEMMRKMGFDFNIDMNITPTYSGSNDPLKYKLNNIQIKELIKKDSSYIYRYKIEEINKRFKVQKMSDGICRAGRNLAFIDAEGNVYPCITFKSGNELIYNGKNYLQNIKNNEFGDIWKNNYLFKKIRELEADNFDKCLMCKYDCYCKKCIGVNYKESGELTLPSESYCMNSDAMFESLLIQK